MHMDKSHIYLHWKFDDNEYKKLEFIIQISKAAFMLHQMTPKSYGKAFIFSAQ